MPERKLFLLRLRKAPAGKLSATPIKAQVCLPGMVSTGISAHSGMSSFSALLGVHICQRSFDCASIAKTGSFEALSSAFLHWSIPGSPRSGDRIHCYALSTFRLADFTRLALLRLA
jgi:hypothetical protein